MEKPDCSENEECSQILTTLDLDRIGTHTLLGGQLYTGIRIYMYSFQGTDISCLARNLTSMCLKHSLVARVMVMNPWICFLQNLR